MPERGLVDWRRGASVEASQPKGFVLERVFAGKSGNCGRLNVFSVKLYRVHLGNLTTCFMETQSTRRQKEPLL